MNDVKCEEHEGLMLLFMTTFFLLAATTAAFLKRDSPCLHATIVLALLFWGGERFFWKHITTPSIPLLVFEAPRHRGVFFTTSLVDLSLQLTDALWRVVRFFSHMIVLVRVEIPFPNCYR